MRNALAVIQQVHDEYATLSGRSYGNGLIEKYALDDAEFAVVCVGSVAGTAKTVIDALRAEGVKAGLLRLRTFRPFPVDEIVKALVNVKAVAIMDKSLSFGGNGGAVFAEVRHALYDANPRPFVVDYVFGLGGRDIKPPEIRKIFDDLKHIVAAKRVETTVTFLGVRD
jgi:pyruvate ferredoxin oxidoreductase alpha subunit